MADTTAALIKRIAGGTINGQDHVRLPTEGRSNSETVPAILERGDAHRYRSEASGVNQMGSKPGHISAGGSCVPRIGELRFESNEAPRRRSHREPRKLEEHATVAMVKDNAGKRYFTRPSFEVPISYLIPV